MDSNLTAVSVDYGVSSGVQEGATVDLMDLDGDGWLDIVVVDPYRRMQVYWKHPTDGGGWSTTPQDVL